MTATNDCRSLLPSNISEMLQFREMVFHLFSVNSYLFSFITPFDDIFKRYNRLCRLLNLRVGFLYLLFVVFSLRIMISHHLENNFGCLRSTVRVKTYSSAVCIIHNCSVIRQMYTALGKFTQHVTRTFTCVL